MYRGHYQQHPFNDAKISVKFIRQERFWVDASLNRVPIDSMETDYAIAVMMHLMKQAPRVKLAIELYYEVKGANADKLVEFSRLGSEEFMKSTPLFQAIKVQYKKSLEDPFFMDLEIGIKDDEVEELDDLPY